VAAQHLSALGRELEAPMTNLIETASKTPAAAAEVITVLRGEISKNIERDNSLLEERGEVLEKLTHLADSLAESTDGQRTAIEQLVNSSTEVLQGIGSQFSEQLSAEAQKMTEITSDVAERASQMANLGDAFGSAMELYNESNQTLIENLGRIEASLNESTERSDEQMGYYVAQAREIIDQSMSSQRAIIDELRQSGRQGELLTAEAG
jgi:methyl-accepting chemotaxis protein